MYVYLKFSRAFSLVEIIVVLGIAILILGVILPSLRTVRESAKSARLVSNINQIRNQIEGNFAVLNSFYFGAGTSGNDEVAMLIDDSFLNAPANVSGCFRSYSDGTASDKRSALLNIVANGSILDGKWLIEPAEYAIWGRLGGNKYYCADSKGNAKFYSEQMLSDFRSECY